jgi:hypothetical protein
VGVQPTKGGLPLPAAIFPFLAVEAPARSTSSSALRSELPICAKLPGAGALSSFPKILGFCNFMCVRWMESKVVSDGIMGLVNARGRFRLWFDLVTVLYHGGILSR